MDDGEESVVSINFESSSCHEDEPAGVASSSPVSNDVVIAETPPLSRPLRRRIVIDSRLLLRILRSPLSNFVGHRSTSFAFWGNLGVVLNSASRREAKRGQSTNRKGKMSRASHQKAKNSKRNLNVTTFQYFLSLFGQTLSLFGQTNCPGLRTLCPKRLLGFEEGMYEEKYVIVCNHYLSS